MTEKSTEVGVSVEQSLIDFPEVRSGLIGMLEVWKCSNILLKIEGRCTMQLV